MKYRAILIDPEKRSLTEIQVGDSLEELYAVLQCRHIASGAHLSGSISKGFDSIFVSDDDLEDGDDPRFWFQVDVDRNPPSSYPLAGLGLAHGTDTMGALCDVSISVADLAKRITYTQRKFRGFTSETFTPAKGDSWIHPVLKVEAIVPIIDGTDEGDDESRPESWDAKMLSGKPLITEAQFEQLLANAPKTLDDLTDHDPVPVVKIFLPHVRWLLGWIYPNDHDRAFAVVKRAGKNGGLSIGDVRLSEIAMSRLGMLKPERDLHIRLKKPLSHYMQHPDIW